MSRLSEQDCACWNEDDRWAWIRLQDDTGKKIERDPGGATHVLVRNREVPDVL